MSSLNDSKLAAKVLERCMDMMEGGKAAKKHEKFYDNSDDYNRQIYASRFNVNSSYKATPASLSRGNINVTGGKTGPNLSGFSRC